jgi:hypothetical protein
LEKVEQKLTHQLIDNIAGFGSTFSKVEKVEEYI